MSKKLKRNPKEGYVGGVSQGLYEWTGFPAILWRIIFIYRPFIYLILWVFLKEDES
jgi:phage shock protein PspC (stress-responsive transcriptional regulator)|tara:strand:- start:138 stop:305 length:168 start_codon:yes stop_codon:yes gene_type:complete